MTIPALPTIAVTTPAKLHHALGHDPLEWQSLDETVAYKINCEGQNLAKAADQELLTSLLRKG